MVYLLLADGFEEIEAMLPVDILRRGKIDITTVSVSDSLCVRGAHGISLTADITVKELLASGAAEQDMQMLVLPGGMPGADNLDKSPDTDTLISAAVRRGAYLAAICAAPMILGKRGLLRGLRATCYPSFEPYLEGAVLSEDRVVCDRNVITAAGMGVALSFGLALLRALAGEAEAERVRASVLA